MHKSSQYDGTYIGVQCINCFQGLERFFVPNCMKKMVKYFICHFCKSLKRSMVFIALNFCCSKDLYGINLALRFFSEKDANNY